MQGFSQQFGKKRGERKKERKRAAGFENSKITLLLRQWFGGRLGRNFSVVV